jgi:hypothetical protein
MSKIFDFLSKKKKKKISAFDLWIEDSDDESTTTNDASPRERATDLVDRSKEISRRIGKTFYPMKTIQEEDEAMYARRDSAAGFPRSHDPMYRRDSESALMDLPTAREFPLEMTTAERL